MKENSSFFGNWLQLRKKIADDIHSRMQNGLGVVSPETRQQNVESCDFETCECLTFENIVTWISENSATADGATGALVRKAKLEGEDFKLKVEIFFIKDNNILPNIRHKVYACNSLEEDLEDNFSGGEMFVIK